MPDAISSIPTAKILDRYDRIFSLTPAASSEMRASGTPAQARDMVRISQEARERLERLNEAKKECIIRQEQLRRDRDEAIKRNLELLELGTGASREEIRNAYRQLMRNYHPDRYSHLPPEFRALAESKAKQIIEAYDHLMK